MRRSSSRRKWRSRSSTAVSCTTALQRRTRISSAVQASALPADAGGERLVRARAPALPELDELARCRFEIAEIQRILLLLAYRGKNVAQAFPDEQHLAAALE